MRFPAADHNVVTPIRPVLVAVAAVVTTVAVGVPATSAHATIDVNDTIRALADDTADLVVEERQLVALADPRNVTVTTTEQVEARERLRIVDDRGRDVLIQLELLDVEVTEAMRTALEPLPDSEDLSPAEFAAMLPQPAVYNAAVADLQRIAATPEASTPRADGTASPAIGLLIVGALSLLALGAAALGNTLRRRDDEDIAGMAWSDGLTGFANRRRLDRDLADAHASSGPTAVIMVDVDDFQSVNAAVGHLEGDEILRRVGAMLAELVRRDDVIYRYGGEEFCILLPDSSIDEAASVAARIVEAARTIELPGGANITVSVGVAGSADGDAAAAVETADRALLDAKEQGRDRAVTFAVDRSLEPA